MASPYPPQPAQTLESFASRLPIKPGQIVSATSGDRFLAQVEWDRNIPVPPEMAEIVAEHISAAQNVQGIYPIDPATPPLVVTETPFDALPPAKQAELKRSIQGLLAREQSLRAADSLVGAAPGVREAMALAAQGEMQRAQQAPLPAAPPRPTLGSLLRGAAAPTPPIVEPVVAPAPVVTPVVTPVGATAAGSVMGMGQRSDAMPSFDPIAAAMSQHHAKVAAAPRAADTPAPAPAPAPAPLSVETHSGIGHVNCPHCGWDLKRADEIEPTDADKYGYLALILGAPYFHRACAFFGDALIVTFRSLSLAESQLVFTQLAADVRAERLPAEGAYVKRLLEYRMTLSCASFEFKGRGLVTIPTVSTLLADKVNLDGEATPLPALTEYIATEILASETVYRAVSRECMRFQKLAEKLEANAINPDFWKGIGSQP